MKFFRKFFFVFTLTGILINSAFSQVNVTQNFPATAFSGSEFTVDVMINKEQIDGFAKFQAELPDGFSATVIEGKNSSFTYSDQKVKFIWMSLPTEKEFKISYKVAVAQNFTGLVSLGGTFSYVENNETQKFKLPQGTISIDPGSASARVGTAPEKTTPPVTPEPTKPARTQEMDSNVPVVPVEKTETTPEPVKEDQTVPSPATAVTTPPSTYTPPPAATPPPSAPATMGAIPSPSKASGVQYRVQLAATQSPAETGFFKNKYDINEQVFSEMHDGWNKYTTGQLKEYSQARNLRNAIREKGVAGAFVVAYNNSKRISVQEALILTKQKWVP